MPTETERRNRKWHPISGRILWILTLGGAAGTLGGLLGSRWWVLELLSHFQIQYATLAATALLCFALLKRTGGVIAASLVLAINLSLLLPLFEGRPLADVSHKPALRLVYANIHTSNLNHQPLLNLIAKEAADIIMLAEVTDRWVKALSSLDGQYPHKVLCPRIDNFGIGLWSRHPLKVGKVHYWGDANVPSILAELDHQGEAITILLTHPLPPMRRRLSRLRDQQLRQLAGIAQSHGDRTILLGDFNATAFSPIFDEVLAISGLLDSTRGFGPQPSWPAGLPWILRIPIDHCLHSADLTVTERRVGPSIGSDHLPILLELR
jgi:endonuclease/exonuclease/phosphatase (EEP) superfamily protein YafD